MYTINILRDGPSDVCNLFKEIVMATFAQVSLRGLLAAALIALAACGGKTEAAPQQLQTVVATPCGNQAKCASGDVYVAARMNSFWRIVSDKDCAQQAEQLKLQGLPEEASHIKFGSPQWPAFERRLQAAEAACQNQLAHRQ